jgi:heat shock protein HslJ
MSFNIGIVTRLVGRVVLASFLGLSADVAPGSIAASQTRSPEPAVVLAGTSWQLVKFQGSDGTTLTTDDGAKYTIEFGADGRLTARIDCNRGRGTWKSDGSNQVQFGPHDAVFVPCA